jgi:outer membrane PBP1 activator LpoA protein
MTTRSTFHLRTRLAVAPLIVVFSLSGCAVLQPRGEKVGLPTTAGYAKDQSIAVMLPTGNERFSKPAKAIEQGIKDARSCDEEVKLRPGARYEDSSDNPFEVYHSVVEEDPTIVIGPFLPSHVKQLAYRREDETSLLALDSADAAATRVYPFALKPEAEAGGVGDEAVVAG